jgi:methylmalonyl-CoA/ethylmalonyl-CoA epimerase
MATIKRIDHVAILVDDMDKTLSFWQEALGIELSHIEDVPAEQARVAFLLVGTPRDAPASPGVPSHTEIELVQPTTGDSGLARYLEKRGPGMQHICLEVDDIEEMLSRLKEKGVQLINETPVIGMGGKKYAFIHPKSANGVMVELYELPTASES